MKYAPWDMAKEILSSALAEPDRYFHYQGTEDVLEEMAFVI